MRITCLGGGPAGLYFALLMKKQDPTHEVRVIERNKPGDTFGWGVVFSDQTLGALREADPETADEILTSFNHWDDIEVRFKGKTLRSGGHGFCGIGRKKLLNILQRRCEELGVELIYEVETVGDEGIEADLIIACDGLNSRVRAKYAQTYKPNIDTRRCRFVWLGTERLFEAFTFDFQQTEWGWFQAHAYQFDGTHSTFIVETPDEVWRAAGLEDMSKEEGIAFCERLFADVLEGHKLISNSAHLRGSSQWVRFPRVICDAWVHTRDDGTPVVLMGDAAHTAHFSIGSGTKLALEDAISLAGHIGEARRRSQTLRDALDAYQAARSVEVLRIQNAARNSTEWFEEVARHARLPPEQLAYSLLTRSQRISHENLRLRDAAYVGGYEEWFAAQAGLPAAPVPPMFTPFRLRDLTLHNRVVVSPMAQYSAAAGVVGDFHMVHLGARAHGGAALVFAEMTAPSADGRITPGCPGLYTDEQERAWARVVGYIHAHTPAKVAMQLGHAGAKGATRLAWDGIDLPLREGEGGEGPWPLISASPQRYLPVSQEAREMTRADMDRVRDEFAAAARRAAAAGFDWLELHCAHGYLLSSFISPLTNQRADEYGGELASRLRYPLEVFAATRAAWPAARPMSVRISAHDWVEGGLTPREAVEVARAFRDAGADIIDVSSGQVSKAERPVYGRMWQTPFSELIRSSLQVPTIAVGAISEADHVNSIIAAGRADLCAVGRPHLANPSWALHEASKIGYTAGPGLEWPRQYHAGKAQLDREHERARAQAAQAAGLSPLEQANRALGV